MRVHRRTRGFLIQDIYRIRARNFTTLGIRREDPSRVWERRAPLTPSAVAELFKAGKGQLEVQVESCGRRCFPDLAFCRVGANIVPSLQGDVDLVLGIKEPPMAEVLRLVGLEDRKRIWMVFSHTHKGQEYNTPLLAAFLDPSKTQTLIDYELLTTLSEDQGVFKRAAGFGWFAGAVGAGEALSMTGLALLKRGIATSLLHLPRPHTFPSLVDFKQALGRTGEVLRSASSRQTQEPMILGIIGAGNVADGARDMLDTLGVTWIDWQRLESLRTAGGPHRIYACAIPPSAYFTRFDGSPYNREDYYTSPDQYRSVFAERIAPHLTTLINGAGWRNGFPTIMSNVDLETPITSNAGRPKLVAVQDITCDIKGNLEFVDRHTTIDQPYFDGPGELLISAVDILPTELPADASEHFSSRILPYVRRLLNPSQLDKEKGESLGRAVIVDSGELTAQHSWLQTGVDALRAAESPIRRSDISATPSRIPGRKKVLLLGSGLVAGPAVEVFAARTDQQLIIASNNSAEAHALVRDRSNLETLSLDVGDDPALGRAVSASDVVVSLLPAPMHPQVAKHCIAHGKHLVTASYISPDMAALDQAAKENDVLLLGECGLDPGIDSMAAMRIHDRVRREGKRVSAFISWCGGLPQPSSSNVPLGYKFSWSPRAVLTAALNDARYKLDGQIREISGDKLLFSHLPSVPLWRGLALEGLANRDSLPYAEKYGLGPVEGLTDLFRGTLRYQGFSRLLDSFRRLGLLSVQSLSSIPASWEDFFLASTARAVGSPTSLKPADVRSAVSDIVGTQQAEETLEALRWLSLLPDSRHSGRTGPRITSKQIAPIDLFAHLLSAKLAYLPHERDIVLLHHSFKLNTSVSDPSAPRQTVTVSLFCTGTEEASAMATTVGKTLAFAALRVLDGHVKGRGVKGPYEREVWEGVLERLEEAGVRVVEEWS